MQPATESVWVMPERGGFMHDTVRPRLKGSVRAAGHFQRAGSVMMRALLRGHGRLHHLIPK